MTNSLFYNRSICLSHGNKKCTNNSNIPRRIMAWKNKHLLTWQACDSIGEHQSSANPLGAPRSVFSKQQFGKSFLHCLNIQLIHGVINRSFSFVAKMEATNGLQLINQMLFLLLSWYCAQGGERRAQGLLAGGRARTVLVQWIRHSTAITSAHAAATALVVVGAAVQDAAL